MKNKIVKIYTLKELADIQLEKSKEFCDNSCRSYHSSWAILRTNNLVGGIDSDSLNFIKIINSISTLDKNSNILIAGSADSGILNMVLSSNAKNSNIFCIDKCFTPLSVCKEVFDFENINYIKGDLLNYDFDLKFDLIISHSLISFFNDQDRKKLLNKFSNLLSKEGNLLLSVREKNQKSIFYNLDEWIDLKTQYAIENINNNYFPKNQLIKIFNDFYKIMYSFNFPYSNFEEINKEFEECNLLVIQNLYGGSGLSFQSDKPKSIIVLANKVI